MVARKDNEAAKEFVAVARVVKVRGLRGEVAADLLTDFPERFEGLEKLIAVKPSGGKTELKIESFWFHGGRIIFKFAGFNTPEDAGALVGYELAVPEAECVELEDDEFFDWQLIDCQVETVDNLKIGTVREVLHTGSAPILVIRGDKDSREHLIPLAESICISIDTERKLIRVDAPEGLLEV